MKNENPYILDDPDYSYVIIQTLELSVSFIYLIVSIFFLEYFVILIIY